MGDQTLLNQLALLHVFKPDYAKPQLRNWCAFFWIQILRITHPACMHLCSNVCVQCEFRLSHWFMCVCVSKACVCPLFTLQCCLVQCWCMWSLLRAFIVDRYRFDKSRAQNNGLWLEKRSVSLSSKTPQVDQSDGVKKRMTHSSLLCPLSLSLSQLLAYMNA